MATADRWGSRKEDVVRMSTQTETEPQIPDWKSEFLAICAQLPEKVELPYHLTPEGERLAKFKRTCPDEFRVRIEHHRLKNPTGFKQAAEWNGQFPGPCCVGVTGGGKTRAAWSALGRLYVKENKSFAWFPVKRLVTEFERYESYNAADEFFRTYDFFGVLMVDDLDKINWQFESQGQALFAFYDWVYRTKKPCITTTNKGRDWWLRKMGDAFVRRLFDEAHFTVTF